MVEVERTTGDYCNITSTKRCRVGFLPAETCFCHASGLNRFKPAKTWFKPAKT